uniref:Uncharacterized protein n=1 Tax=Timema monikensis TaxID=170555 RepID=A0A7R9E7J2_9NEOP|nr:unnamed protein product [Timema monikensis]
MNFTTSAAGVCLLTKRTPIMDKDEGGGGRVSNRRNSTCKTAGNHEYYNNLCTLLFCVIKSY